MYPNKLHHQQYPIMKNGSYNNMQLPLTNILNKNNLCCHW